MATGPARTTGVFDTAHEQSRPLRQSPQSMQSAQSMPLRQSVQSRPAHAEHPLDGVLGGGTRPGCCPYPCCCPCPCCGHGCCGLFGSPQPGPGGGCAAIHQRVTSSAMPPSINAGIRRAMPRSIPPGSRTGDSATDEWAAITTSVREPDATPPASRARSPPRASARSRVPRRARARHRPERARPRSASRHSR